MTIGSSEKIRVSDDCSGYEVKVAFKQCGEALVKPRVGISIDVRFEFLEPYKKVEVTVVRIKLARSR